MKNLLIVIALLFSVGVHAQAQVTGNTATFHFEPVVNAFDNTPLSPGVLISYNIYASQGCGQKTLVTAPQVTFSPTKITVTIPALPGCLSIAVSASDSSGESDISDTLVFTVSAPPPVVKKPAKVIGLSAGP